MCLVHIENSHHVYFDAQTSQALESPNLWLIYQIAHRCHAWGYVYYLTWMSCGHLSTFKTKQMFIALEMLRILLETSTASSCSQVFIKKLRHCPVIL